MDPYDRRYDGFDARQTQNRATGWRDLFNLSADPGYQGQFNQKATVLDRESLKLQTALDIGRAFKDRHIIVTGASGAVGSEVVKQLLSNGAKVAVFGRSKENMAYLKSFHTKKGSHLFQYTLDFSMHPLDFESKFREAVKDLGGVLHSLIVCHGLSMPGSIRTLNLKEWDRCMNVNVRSTFMAVSLAIPFLKLRSVEENPSVCILSGNSGIRPLPGYTALSVAKAMVNSFIECAALEMAYFGIRVNGVSTSLTSRNLEKTYAPGQMAKVSQDTLFLTEQHLPLELHPITRQELEDVKEEKVSEPQDIADAVVWLCSNEATFVTGEILNVDSGFMLAGPNYLEYDLDQIRKEKENRNLQMFSE